MNNKFQDNLNNIKKEHLNDEFFDRVSLKLLDLRLSSTDKQDILDQISARLKDGDSLKETLRSLSDAYKSQQPKGVKTKFLRILLERFNYKPKLSYILAPFFDSMTIGVVGAIESEKDPYQVLSLCVSNLTRKNKMRGVAIAGVLGPIAAILMIIIACSGAHLWVYKSLLRGLKIQETQLLMTMANLTKFVYEFSPIFILILLLYLIWTLWSIPNQIKNRPRNLPPWNIIDSVNSAIVLQTYGELLKVGVPSSQALSNIGEYQSPYVRHWCQRIRLRMINGHTEGQALSCDFFRQEPRIEIESYAQTSEFTSKTELISEKVFKSTEKLVSKMATTLVIFGMASLIITCLFITLSIMSIKPA